jgi:hypothetical protein
MRETSPKDSPLIVIKIGTAIWFLILVGALAIHKDSNIIFISMLGTALGVFGHFYSARRLRK